MKRRKFLAILAAGAVCASPVFAQDIVQSIVGQLRQQGFVTITTETTLLGRVRILAISADGQREIIVNPRSGEILRDLWIASANGVVPIQIIGDAKEKGEDEADDEEDDEEADDDGDGSDDDGGGDDED